MFWFRPFDNLFSVLVKEGVKLGVKVAVMHVKLNVHQLHTEMKHQMILIKRNKHILELFRPFSEDDGANISILSMYYKYF